jgi:GT2 family glycosyltransferase/glycosyltransferase involved in cell wall biosynthesis
MKKIAHFGAFDHSSFGDLLFPRIAEHFLSDFQLIHIAPTHIPSGWHDAQPIIGVHEALDRTDWNGILIGGGDIIQTGAWSSEKWKRHFDTPFCSLPSIWAGACLLSAKLDIPLAWNSPGVPAPFPANYAEIARLALDASDYLAVRDQSGANHLSQYTGRSISIVPDSAILMRQVWQARSGGSDDLAVSIGRSDIDASVGDIRCALASYRKSRGKHAKTVAVQLMPWEFEFDDYEGALRKNDIDADVAPPLHIQSIVDTIANSNGYIGNSLHGLIAAISYGIPAVLVPPAGKSSHKYEGFLRTAGLNVSAHLATSWTMAVELLAAQGQPIVPRATVECIEAHWTAIRTALNACPVGKKQIWSQFSRLLSEQGERLGLLGMTPDCFRDNSRSAIDQLGRVASERASHIKSLHEEITTRDTLITRLTTAAVERDGQIASLGQAVSERDVQIASLSQTVTERDGQIANLTEEAVRRGEWALRLDAELKETQAKLSKIAQSNSWRLTKPLRELRRWTTQPAQQAHRYMRAGLRLSKHAYQALPLSAQTKAKHRSYLAKVAPTALLLSGSHALTIPALAAPAQTLPQQTSSPIDPTSLPTVSALPTSNAPHVSVVIPIYGKLEYTLRCLDSIVQNPPTAPFEVIVVDDCSSDNSVKFLQNIVGIRLIQNSENQGFIRSCNSGASAALGKYVLFLNNDTQVTSEWLDALLQTFRDFPGTGLAGSKLVYPDDRLQEAGGIIWQDGSAWNFGRFQDPSLPVYNYAREVDYCSGASIMVPKALFDELGGFDEHYLPAYCEDSDLALKIRDKGYRVIYQPMSSVIHFEGVTSGTDTSQGVKAYQVENAKKLFARWQERLKGHQEPGHDVDNAKDRRAKHRVLVLDHCTPTPDQDAGSVTVFNLLLLLREMDFQVTFIPEDNFLYMPGYTTALQAVGIEVLYAPHYTSVAQHLKEAGQRYDLAFLFRPGVVERHLKDIRKYCPKTKVLYHTVDLHFLRMTREAELLNDSLKLKEAEDMKGRELAAIQSSDASIVHSTAEFELLSPALPEAKLHVFPLIMNVPGTTVGFQQRRDLVFVGGYQHTPNVDAVKFMVKEIMPLLRQRLPGVRFYAVGSKPPEEIKALACEDVVITGFVKDLNPLLDKMRVLVAPLRYGAGIKGKIGTAMAVGLPVVASSLAAEGMSLTDGENILIADDPESFLAAIVNLYESEEFWCRLSVDGVKLADHLWGGRAAWKTFQFILKDLGFKFPDTISIVPLYSSKQ